jgi:hypothetical protein
MSAAPREWPLIFAAHSIRAIREGRKTQTRRVLARANALLDGRRPAPGEWEALDLPSALAAGRVTPRWRPGDLVWIKEGFVRAGGVYVYREGEGREGGEALRWNSPLFMPREACRTVLAVVDVRIERLEDIGESDAEAEGAPEPPYREGFRAMWDRLNAGRGFGWDTNPWVAVLDFRLVPCQT